MDVADLVGVHEARIAHHVAAVRQIDRQDRAAPVFDGTRAVIMQALIVVGTNIAAGKVLLDPTEGS